MGIACPSCGARKLRLSRVRGFLERLATLCGVYPIKCAICDARFHRRIWTISHLLFAKCSRCHKMDLAKWSDHHYHAPFSLRIKLAFGARRRRCVYCRYNFASWRPLKEEFDAQKRIERSHIRTPTAEPTQVFEEEEHSQSQPH